MELQKAHGILRNAYYQGHGRYVNQLVRLTLKFCKFAGNSREARKFIETRLVDVARENPGCVIYVQPRLFKAPVLKADYLNGANHHLSFYNMSAAQIECWIKWHITRSGYELYRLDKSINSAHTSIQGIWNPFTFRDPSLNTTKFPNEEVGRHSSVHPSATEQLVEIAKSLKV